MEQELLYRFFDNRATRAEEEQILDWLESDPANGKRLLAERKFFDAALMHADGKHLAEQHSLLRMPRWAREVAKYAAVLVLAFGVAGFYVVNMREQLLASTNTITVPAGQHVDLTLPDGTKVCMNALSTLEYPSYFAGGDRKVRLTGEAFFEVTHDAEKPFVVETFACNVEVLGTKFDVEARDDQGLFSAALVEGSVRVSDRQAISQPIVLTPGQRAHYRGGRFEVESLPQHEQFQWRGGVIAFRDATFSELIGKFEQYYGVRIEMAGKQIPTVFTGKIRISEGVDHALWVLQQNAAFTYTRNTVKDIIYIQ